MRLFFESIVVYFLGTFSAQAPVFELACCCSVISCQCRWCAEFFVVVQVYGKASMVKS